MEPIFTRTPDRGGRFDKHGMAERSAGPIPTMRLAGPITPGQPRPHETCQNSARPGTGNRSEPKPKLSLGPDFDSNRRPSYLAWMNTLAVLCRALLNEGYGRAEFLTL